MTAYRSPGEAHPSTDSRRASALRAYLRRLAPALTPGWIPTGGTDDFGSALLEVAARLAEETTRRVDGTAERDALAFFDYLGLPPSPPRAATGVLVLALADEFPRAVFAPARTQVMVAGPSAEVTFETREGLRVVPGRIGAVVAVDPAADRIELAPAHVTSMEPPAARPARYEVASYAGAGSRTLQLRPAAGLDAADILRIGSSAHRLAAVHPDGLVTLLDPLTGPVVAGTRAVRIVSLESFAMRNLQQHALWIGHKELFKLDQPAEIEVHLAPAGLARELTRLDVAYSLYGTRDDEDEPRWQPLDLLGANGPAVRLAKSWPGSVDETEVDGRKSRWLRAELRGAMPRRVRLTSSALRLRLGVTSMADGATGGVTEEGSRTVVRAAHNGTPLATTRRFLPFGPEPLRFDVFALAAGEALSKRGARATIKVTMADASLSSFAITATAAALPAFRGYGAGGNGDLQVLSFTPGQALRWQELKAAAGDGGRLRLTGATAVGVSMIGYDADVVFATDRDGNLWSARIRHAGGAGLPVAENDGWQEVNALPKASARPGQVAGPAIAPAPAGLVGMTAVLFDVAQGVLHARTVNDRGRADAAGWRPTANGSAAAPSLTGAWQLLPVQGVDWPARPEATELLATDDDGALWLGVLAAVSAAPPLTVDWTPLDSRRAAVDVRPAATRFRTASGGAGLWVAYGGAGGEQDDDRALHGLARVGDRTQHVDAGGRVARGTGLHADPAFPGGGQVPVTAGMHASREVLIWPGRDQLTVTALPGDATVTRPLVLRSGDEGAAELVVGGAREQVFRAAISRPPAIDYELHDVVEFTGAEVAHRLEVTGAPADPAASTMVDLGGRRRRIKRGDLRLYQLDEAALASDLTLRFFRHTGTVTYTGSIDDPGRTMLTLDARDRRTTRPGMWLIIGSAGYRVAAISADRVARLENRVLGDDTRLAYRPARLLHSRTVGPDELRTLVELATTEPVAPGAGLVFGAGVEPASQTLRLQQQEGPALWARLDAAWTVPPAATGQVAMPGVVSPEWRVSALDRGYQNPELSWEYFDGQGWRRLEQGFLDNTENLSTSGDIHFVVPADVRTTDIGGNDDYWIRARLIGGDYGRPKYLVRTVAEPDATVQTIVVDSANLRPPEILAVEVTFDLVEQPAPEIVLVGNNLDVSDQTQAAASTAARFDVFQGALAVDADVHDRAVYLGLTAAVGRGSLTFLVDAADRPGTGPLRADLRTADGWRPIAVDDRTESFRRRGMVTVTLEADPFVTRLFGREQIWLRFRPAAPDTGGPWAPVVHRLLLNAVGISHARTVVNEILGSSLGEPAMTVELAGHPVLPETVRLRVREELTDEERAALEAEHRAAAGAGRQQEEPVVESDLDRIPGTWVLWRRVDSLLGLPGNARVYLLEPSSGRVRFGDNRTGRIPPAGRDSIRCFSYQQGGGANGNVPAWSPARLTSAVEGVDAVVLPVDAAGGFDTPVAGSLFATAPHRLRHAGRALCPADVEALAVASSAAVIRAHCARPVGPRSPIVVTIAVRGESRCPLPTLAQQDAVAAMIRQAGWGGLAGDAIQVRAPAYVSLKVAVHLVAPRACLAEAEATAKQALVDLFDPATGGPDGRGWPFGRGPTPGDVLRALGEVPGVDRVTGVDVTASGGGSLDRMPADGLVCAEATDISVVVTSVEGTP